MKIVHLYDENEFKSQARALLAYYGLPGWKVKFNSDQATVGQCHHTKMRLEFSSHHLPNLNPIARRDVLLHEIAHAIAGAAAGHGPEWRKVARSIGCTALEAMETKKFVNKEIYYTWIGECPKGHKIGSHFKPKNFQNLSCPKCSPDGWHYAFRYTWFLHGTMVFDPALDEMGLGR